MKCCYITISLLHFYVCFVWTSSTKSLQLLVQPFLLCMQHRFMRGQMAKSPGKFKLNHLSGIDRALSVKFAEVKSKVLKTYFFKKLTASPQKIKSCQHHKILPWLRLSFKLRRSAVTIAILTQFKNQRGFIVL